MGPRANHERATAALAASMLLTAACGAALGNPLPTPPRPRSDQSGDHAEVESEPAPRVQLPRGRDIGRLSPDRCAELLGAAGVGFSRLGDEVDTGPIDAPVRLEGPLGGLEIRAPERNPNNQIVDCRLALTLLVWAPELREQGIVAIEHMSTYRPGARVARNGEPSGHARAMAIDVGSFVRADGTSLEVVEIWDGAARRADPCEHPDDEGEELAMLRELICDAAEAELFQVVLTPHYDRAHRNHVHLELKPEVDWSFVR